MSYIGGDKENGVALIPMLQNGYEEQKVIVFLNQKAIPWGESLSQIFVCYNRLPSMRSNNILNDMLQKFVHISALTANDLFYDTGKRQPIEILYFENEQ